MAILDLTSPWPGHTLSTEEADALRAVWEVWENTTTEQLPVVNPAWPLTLNAVEFAGLNGRISFKEWRRLKAIVRTISPAWSKHVVAQWSARHRTATAGA